MTMRILMMHKHEASTEAGNRPSMDVITKMGAFIGEHAKAGRFIDGAGLGPTRTRTRLTFRNGQCTVKHGPYHGEHELPAALLVMKVATREQGIGWAERYGKILGDCELELGKVTEAWDLGLIPEPENPPLQLLLVEKADAATEAGGRTAQQKAAISRLKTEMAKAGVLVSGHTLAPSSRGKRLVSTSNKMRVLDGPFVESKEMIGGFSIMELPSLDAAIEIARPYVEILGGTLEIDLRVVEA
jgi:hypothetical protein